jgi:hypothetical protein
VVVCALFVLSRGEKSVARILDTNTRVVLQLFDQKEKKKLIKTNNKTKHVRVSFFLLSRAKTTLPNSFLSKYKRID